MSVAPGDYIYLLLYREDERMSTGERDQGRLEEEGEVSEAMRSGEGEGGEEEEVPRINVEIPRCVANLGADIHFVKLPNFLSVETRSVVSYPDYVIVM